MFSGVAASLGFSSPWILRRRGRCAPRNVRGWRAVCFALAGWFVSTGWLTGSCASQPTTASLRSSISCTRTRCVRQVVVVFFFIFVCVTHAQRLRRAFTSWCNAHTHIHTKPAQPRLVQHRRFGPIKKLHFIPEKVLEIEYSRRGFLLGPDHVFFFFG